ncbi:MAG: PAS domain S-box protein [Thermodesulfobacteriota bacterium]
MKILPYRSPVRLVIIMTLSIYAVEFFVMMVLKRFPLASPVMEAFIDSTLLITFLVPFLFLFLFRPLILHIRDRQNVERALIKERDRVQRYLDVAGVMLVVLNRDGTVRLINRRGCEILGCAEEEVLGSNFFKDHIPEKYREEALGAFNEVFSSGGHGPGESYEGIIETCSGDERVVLWHHRALSENGVIRGDLVSGEDITERKRIELFLKESESRFRLIHNTAFDAIIIADSNGHVTECNPAAEEIFGYPHGELTGVPLLDLMPEKYREAHREAFKRFLETGVSRIHGKILELEGRKKNNEDFPVEFTVNSFSLGERVFFSSTIRDITERKKAEEEKETIRLQLNQAQKMDAIGRLAGGIAHDFNNILTTIRGNAELTIELVGKFEEAQSNLREIILSVAHAAKLTRQLLIFSRGHPFELLPINLNSSVESLLLMMKRLLGEDIEIITSLQEGLWTVRADEGSVEQVLLNLSVNARDAMPGGGRLTISTENVPPGSANHPGAGQDGQVGEVCITVRDTGTGISEDVMQRIFEPFFSTKETGKGTGLGLSVVYGVVKQHGGWIDVESAPDKGSVFRVFLPAVSDVHEVHGETEAVIHEGLGGEGRRVLLIEDDIRVRSVAVDALRENGYTVFQAGSGEEAMEIFRGEAEGFDLIFSDVVLPDCNGVDLVEKIIEERPAEKVLLTSGYVGDKARWDLINERGYRFLQKPYSLADLFETVDSVIRGGT